MKRNCLILLVIIISLCLIPSIALCNRGCCSHHGGVIYIVNNVFKYTMLIISSVIAFFIYRNKVNLKELSVFESIIEFINFIFTFKIHDRWAVYSIIFIIFVVINFPIKTFMFFILSLYLRRHQ